VVRAAMRWFKARHLVIKGTVIQRVPHWYPALATDQQLYKSCAALTRKRK